MCGRYVATKDADGLVAFFMLDERDPRSRDERVRWDGPASYNVAPTDQVPALVRHDGQLVLTGFRWGLVPFWAEDPKIGARMINARAETVATKSAFAESFEQRRCLLPADGFFEWQKLDGQRLPWFVHRTDGEPMVFAGIWSTWRDRSTSDGHRLLTCSILTTDANHTLEDVHDRMPVVLEREEWDAWLDPQADPGNLKALLDPAPDDAVERYRVSTRVNSVRTNEPSLLEPVDDESDAAVVGLGHASLDGQQSLFG
ncbi:SOS response-associated peptidase [Euzebya sp.]|uniref:SOS response-associated peptidase n=1 Tax=Euzebya sp. TaxID=1971409 RepID=UPI0035176BE5